MKRKFNFKRFSLVLTSFILLVVCAFNYKTVKFTSYEIIAKLFNTNDEVTLTFEKRMGDNNTLSVQNQTLVLSQSYYDPQLDAQNIKNYNISIFDQNQNLVVIDSNSFSASLVQHVEYYIRVETDNNVDPTDLCIESYGSCIGLVEQGGQNNVRVAISNMVLFDENSVATLRMKEMCDRINCNMRGFNAQMQDDNGHYYGALNYRIYDDNEATNAVTTGNTTYDYGMIFNVLGGQNEPYSWNDDIKAIGLSLDEFDLEDPVDGYRAGELEWIEVQRLYLLNEGQPNETLMVTRVNDDEFMEYGTEAWAGSLNETIKTGVTLPLEFTINAGQLDEQVIKPYAIYVTGRVRSANNPGNPGNQVLQVSFGGNKVDNSITYNVNNSDVVLDVTGLVFDQNGFVSIEDNPRLLLTNYDPQSMEVRAYSTIDDFSTELFIEYDNEEYYLHFNPADNNSALPNSVNIVIQPRVNGGGSQYQMTLSFNTATSFENGNAIFNVNNKNVYVSIEDVELSANNNGFEYTLTGNRIDQSIVVSNFDMKTMDIWVYDYIHQGFKEKLSSLNNGVITYHKEGNNYVFTIDRGEWSIPPMLGFAVTEKYEYPSDMKDDLWISVSSDEVTGYNDENKRFTFEIDGNTVGMTVSTINDAEFRANLNDSFPENIRGEINIDATNLHDLVLTLDGFDSETMEVIYDISGARGVLPVSNNVVDLTNLVNYQWMDLGVYSKDRTKDYFDGRAYFVWVCEGNDVICYHYVSNLAGRTLVTNKEGLTVLDDNGQPYQQFTLNYININSLVDQSGNNKNFVTIINEHNNDINSREVLANWVRAKDFEELEVKNAATVFGTDDNDRGIQLDPTGGASGENSNVTNGNRNFRAAIYNDEYEAVTFNASPLKYTFFPGYWNQVFFTDTHDISGTTIDNPRIYETYLLEPNLTFTTGENSKSPIVSVTALNVNSRAITITNNDGEFTLTFNSNYYDKVEFELTDADGAKYYLQINRKLADIFDMNNRVYFSLYYPIDYMYDDFKVVANIETDKGTEIQVLDATPIVSEDPYDEIPENAMYISGGKNIFYSQYVTNLEGIEGVKSVYFTVVLKDAFTDADNYGGTFAGSGKGFYYDLERGGE